MPHKTKNLTVELTTSSGAVFTGVSSSIELRTTDGVITITPLEETYLNMVNTTEITLQIGMVSKVFSLKNAAASLRSGHLTVLAEEIHEVKTEAA